ncbi:MAG: TetR/AcrR family transcriptional regulator [Candidatus Binatia bacterium]
MNPAVRISAPPKDRRERRKLEVRRRMIDAAQALFEERGVQAATVAEICERADVAHKTFFNHFPAKQDLVRALADESIEILLADIHGARAKGKDTAAHLTAFFGSVAERASSAGPMRRELLTEIIHAAQQAADEPANARRLHAAFGAIVGDGIAAGEVTRRHPAETLTETILGSYYALMFNWANLDGYPIAKRARAVAAFLADALAPRPEELVEAVRPRSAASPRPAKLEPVTRPRPRTKGTRPGTKLEKPHGKA